jgi:hypothetical protein
MALLLEEAGDEGLTARELAILVTARGLYRKRDGTSGACCERRARTPGSRR